MNDLFELERNRLAKAKDYLESLSPDQAVEQSKFRQLLFHYESLLKQATRITKISDKMTEGLSQYNHELMDKVHVDELTGIYNRRYMNLIFEKYLKTASRSNHPISVLMLDIDFFKKFNDTYGHQDGDICIKKVATALTKTAHRADDIVARYGGEEFIIILPNTEKLGALSIAEKVLNNVLDMKIPHSNNAASKFVTVSVGVTSAVPKHTHTTDVFVKRADEALYTSKNNGRNQFTYLELEDGDLE